MSASEPDLAISVVIPVYNGARFLPDALRSVRRQRPAPAEIIIVDDGSTDETAAVAARLGTDLQYHYQSNRGPAAARNAGLELARGETIAFLDADDWWPDDTLAALHAGLGADPQIDVVMGRTQVVRCENGPDGLPVVIPSGRSGVVTTLGSALMRRRALDRAGRFDETLPYGEEDVDWFLRAREAGIRFVTIDAVTLYYRRHEHNLTHDRQAGSRRLLASLRRSLARRRADEGSVHPFPAGSATAEPEPRP